MYSVLQHILRGVMTPDGVILYSSVLSSRVNAECSECCQVLQIFDLMQVLV